MRSVDMLRLIRPTLNAERRRWVCLSPKRNGSEKLLFLRILKRLARNAKGNTAIEMAFVAPPFLLLLLGIVELGLTLTTQSLLDGAVRDVARQIRTGQLQTQGSPITAFQTQLCSDMSPLISTANCLSNVLFNVQTFSNFRSINFTPCTYNANASGNGTACSFSPGASSQIVGVRVSYARPFIIPWVGACLSGGSCWAGLGTAGGSNPGSGVATLSSTVIFQNEPF